ncbi:MAG: sigma factor-like helix-turn-helix DNA-binding protein [Dehalococcoidales bacterium]|nr:sigma factor-like helix-turn-helix DNA-binding protein [Dehalococcoidales bacterium]
MSWKSQWLKLVPSQRLWVEVFGIVGLPTLDNDQVLTIINRLPQREAITVKLKFGFEGKPLTLRQIGKSLPRADGDIGVSREMARLLLNQALRRLRNPRWRRYWQQVKV